MTHVAFVAEDEFDITPDDTQNLPHIAYGVYCTGAGNLVYITKCGSLRTRAVAAGETVPVAIKAVRKLTTATGLVGYRL